MKFQICLLLSLIEHMTALTDDTPPTSSALLPFDTSAVAAAKTDAASLSKHLRHHRFLLITFIASVLHNDSSAFNARGGSIGSVEVGVEAIMKAAKFMRFVSEQSKKAWRRRKEGQQGHR